MNYIIEEEELEALEEPSEELEDDSSFLEEAEHVISSSHNPFKTSIFPVLIINKQLRIVYANEACEQMFMGFTSLPGKYFFDLFGKAFSLEDVRKIRDTILTGGNGFSWKGTAHLKTRDTVSVQIRVYLFPLEMDLKAPSDFVVMFDDFTEENKKLLRSVFLSLLEASKLKDNDTGKHIIRVNEYSRRLSEELYKIGSSKSENADKFKRIDADFIDNIGFLAAMHDVGKIGTPDDILNKEGPLSDWEWAVMREHTKNGAFILSTYPNPMAKEIALSHHEKWNGTGYPFRLEGDMIPLAARIVMIADVYDALRMARSYKPALSHEVSVTKIIEQSGTHFDPVLIEVFKKIKDDFKKIYDELAD
ncbi:MAG: HD domain-containing protein [Treponema sp.]|nr:HD domain-containing protein [Treponema sp.]